MPALKRIFHLLTAKLNSAFAAPVSSPPTVQEDPHTSPIPPTCGVTQFGTDRYTLLYLKWITNKDLVYRTGNSAH